MLLGDDDNPLPNILGMIIKYRLGSSAMSGSRALSRLLVRCEETGRLLLPQETLRCKVTGRIVGMDQIETCCVTGTAALKRLMLRDSIDGGWLLSHAAARSDRSGRPCHPGKIVRCAWTGQGLLPDEVARCRLTGVTFDSDLLYDGEFQLLRELLNRPWSSTDEELAKELQIMQNPSLEGIRKACAEWNPGHRVAALRVELSNFLGFNRRVAGFIVVRQEEEGRLEVAGQIAMGRVQGGAWRKIEGR